MTSGENMWINLYKWSQSIWELCLLWPQQNWMIGFVLLIWVSLPQVPHLAQVAMVAGIKGAHGLSKIDVCSPRLDGCSSCWMLHLPAQRPAQSLQWDTLPQGIGQPRGGRIIKLQHFHRGRGCIFVLVGIDYDTGCGLASLAFNASGKPTICELIVCLTHCHSIWHISTSQQGTNYTYMEPGGPCPWTSLVLTVFTTIMKQLACKMLE